MQFLYTTVAFGGPFPYQHATDRSTGGMIRRPEKHHSLVVHDDFLARPHVFPNENRSYVTIMVSIGVIVQESKQHF